MLYSQIEPAGLGPSEVTNSPQVVFALDRMMRASPDMPRLLAQCLKSGGPGGAGSFGRAALTPLLVGFCGWLCDAARDADITRLCFLSREGRLMKQAFDILYPQAKTGITTQYLFASRRLVRLAAIHSERDVADLCEGAVFGTQLDLHLAARFGLDSGDIEPRLLTRHGFSNLNDRIDGSAAHGDLAALAFDLRDQIIEKSTARRETLRAYLGECGLTDHAMGLVDIGYSGTVQTAYSRLTEQRHRGFYMLTSPKADLKLSAGYLGNGVPLHDKTLGICRHRHIYETLLCAPEDSVGEISKIDGKWVSRPGPVADCQHRRQFVAAAHTQVCEAIRDLAPGGPVAVAPSDATRILDTVLSFPTRRQAVLLGDLGFDDVFSFNGLMPLVGGPDRPPVWPEGARALGYLDWRDRRNARELPVWTRLTGLAIEPVLRRIGSDRDVAMFRENPHRYFSGLSNRGYRNFGRMMFRAK